GAARLARAPAAHAICVIGEGTMKDDEDDRPKKKIVHEIGQDLALLSVKELQERIALLKDEIARLETSIASKPSSRSARWTFFKKGSPSAHERVLPAKLPGTVNVSLSFLVHYWRVHLSWTLSGSCPLCLTPPC